MKKTLINNKWELFLPDHRAARPEWPEWEKERLESMHHDISTLIQQGKKPVVFDIGAEEGDFPALFSLWGAEVVLFEPNHRVWPNIKAIWFSNNLKNPLGLFVGFAANQDNMLGWSVVDIQPDEGWPACADLPLIGDHGFKHLAEEADSIPQVKIDTFSAIKSIRPDIITIDVEGAEFEVLKGARKTLEMEKPIVYVSIHPEFTYHHFKQYTAELVKFMTDLNYSYKILAFDHEFHFLFTPIA